MTLFRMTKKVPNGEEKRAQRGDCHALLHRLRKDDETVGFVVNVEIATLHYASLHFVRNDKERAE